MSHKDIFPRSLQYLIAIAEHGSYTRAAEAMFVSQPTLSQQIKQLEESLQAPLLDRSGKHVKLTDAGEIYLHHARRAWGELESGTRAIHDVQNLSRGSLRLGWTPITDYLTCALLENFNRRYPGITLTTLEMPADGIEIALAEDKIDFGIAFSKPLSNKTKSNDINAQTLFEETLCLAVGYSHPRAGQKERMSAQEFGRESLVLLNNDFAIRHIIDEYCKKNHITPHIAIETDSLSVIIELIQSGSLATILPKSIIQTQCGIHSIVLAPTLPTQAITMIYRNNGYQRPACIAFAEVAKEWAKNRLEKTPIKKMIPCPLSEDYLKNKN